jgi:hypothetical protein
VVGSPLGALASWDVTIVTARRSESLKVQRAASDEVIIMICSHETACPSADSHDARAACVVADHWEQGWALLCNGLLVFDDEGVLCPAATAA